MAYKLTINVSDKETAERAKARARRLGKNLSDVIDNFLKSFGNSDNPEQTDRIKRMSKRVSVPKSFDYRKELEKELTKRNKR